MSPDDYLISYRQLIHDESKIGWWLWIERECPQHVEYIHSRVQPKGGDRHAAANVLSRCHARQQVESKGVCVIDSQGRFQDVHAQEDTGL
jgi:hypothetical protein